MEPLIHIARNGNNIGAFPAHEIRSQLNAGQLKPDDLAWQEGMTDWLPVRTLFPSSPLPPALPATISAAKISEGVGTVALLLPLVGAALNWFWVGGMNLLQGPSSSVNLIMAAVVIGTAILIAVEAGNLDMGGPNDPYVKRGKRATSPVSWGIATALFWVIAFPAYMFTRSRYGVKNRLIEAVLIAFLYLFSIHNVTTAIADQKESVRQALQSARY